MIIDKKRAGLSLTEMCAIVAILGIVLTLPKISAGFMHAMYKQRSQAEVQQEAQIALYSIIRDVRNSKFVVLVDSETLVVRAFDHRRGYDTAKVPTFFDSINESTITYKYITPMSGSPYLSRTVTYPIVNGVAPTFTRKLMVNLLIQPADMPNRYIFRKYQGSLDIVEVALRCGRGFWAKHPQVFEAQAMRRVSTDET